MVGQTKMNILSKDTLALLNDEVFRKRLEELLEGAESSVTVVVKDEPKGKSGTGTAREPREIVARRLVA